MLVKQGAKGCKAFTSLFGHGLRPSWIERSKDIERKNRAREKAKWRKSDLEISVLDKVVCKALR